MGETVPSLYIDTNIFVYAIEKHPKYGKACARILSDIQKHKLAARCSTLLLVELINVLVKLNKVLTASGEKPLVVSDNISAVLSLPIVWIDLDTRIIETASTYDYSVSGIDYIHIASMNANSLAEIVSADRELDKVRSITRIDPLDYRT